MTNQANKVAVVAETPALVDGRPDGWSLRSEVYEAAWEWRIEVDGVDVTVVNGKRTEPTAPLLYAEPYGETTVALAMPGVTRWLLDSGGYEWCRAGADVRITMHDLNTGDPIGSLGAYVVYEVDLQGGSSGGMVTLMCAGALVGPAGVTHYKPTLEGQTAGDVGTLITAALTFPSQRHTITGATVGVTWDDPGSDFGSSQATVLSRADRLLLEAWTTGPWTVARTSTAADYELAVKDTTTVDATITIGAPGVDESLRQSLKDCPNIIYGSYSTADLPADSAWRTAPLAAIPAVSEYVYSGTTGAVIGANGDYDPTVPRVERYVNVGNFVTRARAEQLAERLIYDPADLPWFGTITLATGVPSGNYSGTGDPAGTIGPLEFREGMNVRVRGLPGNPLLHVVGVELNLLEWTATLTVDEAARNFNEIQAILSRNNDPLDTSPDPTYSTGGYVYDGGGGYYYGGYNGYTGGYGRGTYDSSPPPFVESATEPTWLPPGWGWLDVS